MRPLILVLILTGSAIAGVNPNESAIWKSFDATISSEPSCSISRYSAEGISRWYTHVKVNRSDGEKWIRIYSIRDDRWPDKSFKDCAKFMRDADKRIRQANHGK